MKSETKLYSPWQGIGPTVWAHVKFGATVLFLGALFYAFAVLMFSL